MISTNGSPHHDSHSETKGQFERLADSIDKLTNKVEDFITFASDAVPTKVVYIIFTLVFALLFGVESVRFFFETYLPKIIQ